MHIAKTYKAETSKCAVATPVKQCYQISVKNTDTSLVSVSERAVASFLIWVSKWQEPPYFQIWKENVCKLKKM